MAILTIQPNTADCYIKANVPTTNTRGVTFYCDNNNPYIYRPLIKFDLSSIQSTWTLISVVCSMYCTPPANATHNLYRVLRAWTEAGATWNTYDGSNGWGTVGCDNTTTDRSSTVLSTVETGTSAAWLNYTVNLTEFALMRTSNNGMIMTNEEPGVGGDWGYDSRTGTNTPKLTITYTVGGTQTIWFMKRTKQLWDSIGGIYRPRDLGVTTI